jgi:hypothetical protein
MLQDRSIIGIDINGKVVQSNGQRTCSSVCKSFVLAASTSVAVSVPETMDTVFFKYSAATPVDVWVNFDGAAHLPNDGQLDALLLLEDDDELLLQDNGNILLQSGVDFDTLVLNPDVRTVTNIDFISFFCVSQTMISLEFFTKR